MGELFRQTVSATQAPWTGERMVPSQTGAIEAEHYHRYFLARALCRGKDVLDVASGEGYGSAFLSQTARSVIGVDCDAETVQHATSAYPAANLRFLTGDAIQLPVDDHSVDIVVSFETIEHVADQQKFLQEVKRVLRPKGFLILSTPDLHVYSAPGTAANPFHVKELTESDFRELVSASFRNLAIYRQRAFNGSAILPDGTPETSGAAAIFERRDAQSFEADSKLLRAPYLLAVASDANLPSLPLSLYIQANASDLSPEVQYELDRLRGVEQKLREQLPLTEKALHDAAQLPALQAELDRLRSVEERVRHQESQIKQALQEAARVPALEAELARLQLVEPELERLHQIEIAARQDAKTISELSAELAAVRAEAASCKRTADAMNIEFSRARKQHLQDLDALESRLKLAGEELAQSRNENAELNGLHSHMLEELEAVQSQLQAFQAIARQQALTSQRSMMQLLTVQRDLDTYKDAYRQAANLLIPLRLRRALPTPLKQPARAVKRMIRRIFSGNS